MQSSVKKSRNLLGARAKKRNTLPSGLMLASMLDILMAVLFFLLKNYTTVVTDFAVGKDITLPTSSSTVPPSPALQLVVTQKAILLDDKEIAPIIDGKIPQSELWRDGITIVKLAQALKEQRTRTEFFQTQGQNQDPSGERSFSGTIVLQADKSLKFDLLKRVIYTAGIEDFVLLKLAVVREDKT